MEKCNILENYKLMNGMNNISQYYKEHKLKTLYILSKGFDPRMCESISALHTCFCEIDVILICNDEGAASSSAEYTNLVEENMKKLNGLNCNIQNLSIERDSNLLLLFRKYFKFSELHKVYGRIIIDVSAMPHNIFINLITHMMHGLVRYQEIKLDILICENSELDDAILPTDLSESAKLLGGFDTFSSDLEGDENPITVLIPLLGKGCKDELEKLFASLSPTEICPVLPFPSKNPRRSDEILSVVGRSLFESFLVEISNIVYVAEQNIFDVYIKLYETIKHYEEVLLIIGNPRFYIFIGSSKLIGIGALLASLKLRKEDVTIAFAVVENNGYRIDYSHYKSENNLACCLCLNDSLIWG